MVPLFHGLDSAEVHSGRAVLFLTIQCCTPAKETPSCLFSSVELPSIRLWRNRPDKDGNRIRRREQAVTGRQLEDVDPGLRKSYRGIHRRGIREYGAIGALNYTPGGGQNTVGSAVVRNGATQIDEIGGQGNAGISPGVH